MLKFAIFLVLLPILTGHCVTDDAHVKPGIQPSFDALNPSRVLAVPTFVFPDPGKRRKVDLIAVETDGIIAILENHIQNAFQDQPGVNGVGFAAVRQALGTPPTAWQEMRNEMNLVAENLVNRKGGDRSSFSDECIDRLNYMDFYQHCLLPREAWKQRLNGLSMKALNADAAILVVLSALEKSREDNRYKILAGVSVLLVDTNNGKLIWANTSEKESINDEKTRKFPPWKDVFDPMFSEEFWNGFPGRKPPKASVKDHKTGKSG